MTSNVGSRQILELVGQQKLHRAQNNDLKKKKKRRGVGEGSSTTTFEEFFMGNEGVNGDDSTLLVESMVAAEEYSALSEVVQEELQKEMKPELLNRIDEIIVLNAQYSSHFRRLRSRLVKMLWLEDAIILPFSYKTHSVESERGCSLLCRGDTTSSEASS